MLKIDNQQISLADYLIPEELTALDDELAVIDKYLNDKKMIQPFIDHFHKKHGRPSTPLQVYIRMCTSSICIPLATKNCIEEFPIASNGEGSATYPWMTRFRMVRSLQTD
jgi:hypothetical protein